MKPDLTDFALVVRAIELSLGITCPGVEYTSLFKLDTSSVYPDSSQASGAPPTLSLLSSQTGGRAGQVLQSIIPILEIVASDLSVPNPLGSSSLQSLANNVNRQCLHTT